MSFGRPPLRQHGTLEDVINNIYFSIFYLKDLFYTIWRMHQVYDQLLSSPNDQKYQTKISESPHAWHLEISCNCQKAKVFQLCQDLNNLIKGQF